MASSFPPPPRHPPPLLPPQPQLIAPTPPPPHAVPESEDQSNGSATASMLLVRRLPEAIPHDVLSRLFSHYGASSVRPCAGKVVFASESHLLLRLPLAKVSYIARSIVESPSTGESGDGNPTSD
ncbi:U11/U12 small nuclear ribonucleoprotein 65 kDa protein isoform X1 [Canna indica]|uniref:U11/U12 small nuclear ribonucleoprotein 65 kDa protein isoform X1 n=1 Tax=Canna indica TaxID=4628 RepID=A0AAQ3Q2V9_9LILI|nr:U11/U12 small nuclear ribonucleoprotein 65 kDa protein isoform X1 [Canna indica]